MTQFCTAIIILGILVWPLAFVIAIIRALFKVRKTSLAMYSGIPVHIINPEPDIVEEVATPEPATKEEEVDELSFCQLFELGEEMCLIIQRIEMCPDETAFIRVLGQDSYTPPYKRKVRRAKGDARYIVFNGENYYLDNDKTQPIVSNH